MKTTRRSFLATVAIAISGTDLLARAAAPAEKAKAGPRDLRWDELVPKGWSPFNELRKLKPDAMDDTPEGMTAMRELWDRAPTVPELDGVLVKIPGYVVPLEALPDSLREFLLVPYFGACIHSPPPPANQIVHVIAATPAKGLRAMEVVYVVGALRTKRADSWMGASGYRIDQAAIEPYSPKR